MAVINCPECGEKVSDTVKQCIHCGCEIFVCPECGAIYKGATERCLNCGYENKAPKNNTYTKHEGEYKDVEEIIFRYESENRSVKLLNMPLIGDFLLSALPFVFLIIMVARVFIWAADSNALGTYADVLSSLNTFAILSFILYIVSNTYGEFADHFYTSSLCYWCESKKIDFRYYLKKRLDVNFREMTSDGLTRHSGYSQRLTKIAIFQNRNVKNKNLCFSVVRFLLLIISFGILISFLKENLEIFMNAELFSMKSFGASGKNSGFEFSMITNWWKIIVFVIIRIIVYVCGEINDKYIAREQLRWVEENVNECYDTYVQYVVGAVEIFMDNLNSRVEKKDDESY